MVGRRGRAGNAGRVIALAILSLAAGAAPASAADLISTRVSVSKAVNRSCIAGPVGRAPGAASRSATGPASGSVTARLNAASGDWDVAIYDAATRQRVAGSSYFGASEVAQGFVAAGRRLTVQACRRTGRSRTASLSLDSVALKPSKADTKLSIVRVMTPNSARKAELTQLGLDLTENGGKHFVEVMLHGAADARTLRKAKFMYTTTVKDVVKQEARNRAADARFAAASRRRGTVRAAGVHAAALPSGRTTYRRLDDYNNEMKRLAAANPGLVKPLTLPYKTYLGRSVQGIEITTNPRARDGKPVFINMGVHHAREWPAGEHAMEWAYELINGYKRGDARVRNLVRSTRTIVIPIVNPDGFNTSREAGQAAGAGGGRGGNDTVNFASIPYEYQRKNCRITTSSGAGSGGNCNQQPAQGLEQFGVDPNRNYGSFWGGPGASAEGGTPPGQYAQDYRGPGPFSEPETRNIRALISRRQVSTLITNHTFSGLVLRPPGLQVQGPPPDEGVYKALGDSMAAENGYTSQRSYQLYDTTGSTEDWSYYATGGLGFTFEIGCADKNTTTGECNDGFFHPPYADMIKEYDGTSNLSDQGGRHGRGNREAYFKATESTANAARHSTVSGSAPPGALLRLRKSFNTFTSPIRDSAGNVGKAASFRDNLDSFMIVPDSGRYSWGINPSTRPIVAKTKGRPARGRPSATVTQPNNAPANPCGAATPDNSLCYKDYRFTVPAGAGIDNASATVQVSWTTAASDYDITVYRDVNGNDAVNAGEPVVGSSAQGTTNSESTTFGEPAEAVGGKKYILRVVNFAGGEPYTIRRSFGGPPAFQPARKESYTMTCEGLTGKVGSSGALQIDRGQREGRDFGASCARVACITKRGVAGKRLGPAYLARTRSRQRRKIKVRRLKTRKGMDRYCVAGGGSLRAGYPTTRLSKRVSKRTRKRIRKRAILVITTSKRYRIKRVRVGTRTRTLRRRLHGERKVKIGRNAWYILRGKKSRVVYRVRRGKVRELGIADRKIAATKRGARKLLTAWQRSKRR